MSVIITAADEPGVWRSVGSVLDQTLAGVEAVLVGKVALPRWAAGEPRVRVAWNGSGDRAASGEYAMFLAGGQMLNRHACLTLYALAERSGAQVVCGCGERVRDRCELGVHHATKEFRGPAEERDAAMGGDAAGWLYRRDFLEAAGLWPADQDHAAKAYAAADQVMVVPHATLQVAEPAPAAVKGGRPGARRRLSRSVASARIKRALYRRVLTRLPIRAGSVVFESRSGQGYEGSPRAIYEQLRADGYPGRITWAYDGGLPAGATQVRRLSWGHYRALARAEFWVDDSGFPAHALKRPETTYLQTWHGPSLEFVGFDEPETKLASRSAQRRLQRSVDRFDYFVIGSDYEMRTLIPGLRVRAEPLRFGHPRNDVLVNGGDPERLDRLAAELKLDRDSVTVLYAPRRPGGGPALDVLARDLGDGFTLLARGAGDNGQVGPIVDVSAVDDVASLLLLADALVTDSAPVMFDYALLDRPMIFYMPDLEERMRRRGAYVDLAGEGPGPVVRDQRALTTALRDLEANQEWHRAARLRFAGTYGAYETGSAARQIVDRIFGPGRGPGGC